MPSVSTSSDKAKYLGIAMLGLITGALAAYFIDGLPDMALPAVGILVVAVILYIEYET